MPSRPQFKATTPHRSASASASASRTPDQSINALLKEQLTAAIADAAAARAAEEKLALEIQLLRSAVSGPTPIRGAGHADIHRFPGLP